MGRPETTSLLRRRDPGAGPHGAKEREYGYQEKRKYQEPREGRLGGRSALPVVARPVDHCRVLRPRGRGSGPASPAHRSGQVPPERQSRAHLSLPHSPREALGVSTRPPGFRSGTLVPLPAGGRPGFSGWASPGRCRQLVANWHQGLQRPNTGAHPSGWLRPHPAPGASSGHSLGLRVAAAELCLL